jgi:hypothetical protein
MLNGTATAELWCGKRKVKTFKPQAEQELPNMSIRCLLGFHRRSRRSAHEDGARFVSRCSKCGIAMEKNQAGRWVVLKDDGRQHP